MVNCSFFILDTNRRGGGAGWNTKRSFDTNNGNRRSWRPY